MKLSWENVHKNALESYLPPHQLTNPPHVMCKRSLSFWVCIVCREIFQTDNVELTSRVIWQCVTPLLEVFSRDKAGVGWGWGVGCVGLPLMFGLPPGWIILAHSLESGTFTSILSQNLSLNVLHWWTVKHIRAIFIFRDKSLVCVWGGGNNFLSWPNLFWQRRGDIPHQRKAGWNLQWKTPRHRFMLWTINSSLKHLVVSFVQRYFCQVKIALLRDISAYGNRNESVCVHVRSRLWDGLLVLRLIRTELQSHMCVKLCLRAEFTCCSQHDCCSGKITLAPENK